MTTRSVLLLVPAAVLALSACGDDGSDSAPAADTAATDSAAVATAEAHTLTGEISLEGSDEPTPLPDGSRVEVSLDDISLQDAPAVVLAEQVLEDVESLPVTYALSWEEDLEPGRTYSVGASIHVGDELVYISDTVFPVESGDTVIDFVVIEV